MAGGVVLTAHFKADAHEHNYAEIEDTRVNPTCLKAGSAKYKCKICGEVIEKDIKPLGHDWDGGVQKGAEIIYTCKRDGCGETKVEAAKATPAAHRNTGRDDGTNGGADPSADARCQRQYPQLRRPPCPPHPSQRQCRHRHRNRTPMISS